LALAEEESGLLDQARADLESAAHLLRDFERSGGFHFHDAHFHRDRLRVSNPEDRGAGFARRLDEASRWAAEARRAEEAGDAATARAVWAKAIGGFQAFVGSDFSFAEADQLEMAHRFRSAVEGFLAFAGRAGLTDPEAGSMYFGISNLKGAVFTHLHRIRLER